MSSIKLNEIQMISACIRCAEVAQENCLDLSFEDCIEFLNEAVVYDYHSEELESMIISFVSEKEQK